jgi:hypothetical protein
MKAMFKPLGLAAAVAAVTAGYAGVASAQQRSIGNLGDLAIIPYYSVQGDWVTGVHITNSSDRTQVVKLRLRRASDSADSMDFNLILSPKDVWTGSLSDASGNIVMSTDDNSCTAPLRADGRFEMPFIFRAGAEEGYIEVIGMGSPAYSDPNDPTPDGESTAIAVAAKHDSNGVPFDCKAVESNFFRNAQIKNGLPTFDLSKKGVVNFDLTHQAVADADDYPSGACLDDDGATLCQNFFEEGGDNALKVSYFLRDAASGTEFGGNAVHIQGFSEGDPWMTNQETGLFSGDPYGFDYPDLEGGPPIANTGAPTFFRGQFDELRDSDLLGVSEMLNDWSINPALNVQTDWVVTMPGQYAMLDYVIWASKAGFDPKNCGKLDDPTIAGDNGIPLCDFRDIPVEATLTLYDREEQEILPEDGDLVISPAPPGTENVLLFPYEVNVVEWTDGNTEGFLESKYATSVDASPLGIYGWASLSVEATTKSATGAGAPGNDGVNDQNPNGQGVCQAVGIGTGRGQSPIPSPNSHHARVDVCKSVQTNIPIVGFAAWERSFPANPSANYGRAIDHSFTTSK